MKKLSVTLLLTLLGNWAMAQCAVNATAVAGITMQCSSSLGQTNRCGVAYNPTFNIYYSIDAGSANYPIEAFSSTGAYLMTVPQGFDYRGLWWNPNTNQLEGNGYNSLGIVSQDLDGGTGYPLGTVTNIFSGAQPEAQSCGDYDYDDDEYVYYYNGAYERYDASTNTFIASLPITGLPVTTANLNSNTAFYTGCPGKEYGVYDYVNLRFYFIDKATGAYVATSQLPVGAPAASEFQASYANGKLWLFDNSYLWHSYEVLQACTPPAADITPSGTVDACLIVTPSVLLSANTGTGFSYQWKLNGNNINGAITSLYDATASGNYSVVVTDNSCSATSAATTVNYVSPVFAGIGPSTSPYSICDGQSHTLSYIGSPGTFTYQWLESNIPVQGATNSTYAASTPGSYSLIVDNGVCSDTSQVIEILLDSPPVPVIVQTGNVLSTTISYSSYLWFRDGNTVGAMPTHTMTQPGNYWVRVSNSVSVVNACYKDSDTALYTPVSVNNALINDLAIYPNPSNVQFLIKGHISSERNNVVIKITDITGRIITQEEIQVKNKTLDKQINLPQLSAGTYMLFIICDGQRQVAPLTIN